MTISEDGTKCSLPDGVLWIDSSDIMLIRDCRRDIFSTMLRTKNVLLKGKAGRGKSLFILCIILEILYCTKHNSPSLLCPSARPFPTDPRILYIDWENNRHLVTLNEVTFLPSGFTPKVHYCFSDSALTLSVHCLRWQRPLETRRCWNSS